MVDQVDTCIVGAGVVGLAIARGLADLSPEIFVLEQAHEFGQGISSRNSEVIHAGIYYPKDTLKAVLCVRGKSLLYEYCQQRKISHRRCGKLIVATDAEEASALTSISDRAFNNGLEFWSAAKLQQEEPALRAVLALHSPSTGIISSHELMNSLAADITNLAGQIVPKTEVVSITSESGGFLLGCLIDGEPYQIWTRVLINSAGLGAQQLAARCDFINDSDIPSLYLCKGSYFVYSGKNPFKRLIYPVPEKTGAGLGVHATVDLGGQMKFGPDVEYLDEEDYTVGEEGCDRYYASIRRYFPAIERHHLLPGYAGIRPKLQGPDDPVRDFLIQSEIDHGVNGYVQLFGIESPGLTSCLAIAEQVRELLIECY